MNNFLTLLLTFIGSYLTLAVAYNCLLIAAYFLIKDGPKRGGAPVTRFCVVIPAHNEELLLARLLASIGKQRYPASRLKVMVIADNCTDQTAAIARQHKAQVLVRQDLQLRGKGYAIRHALERMDLTACDAVFIIDADSVIQNGLFEELDRSLRSGKTIIQCYNGVANPDESWFTRLLDVSRTLGNEVYHPAKQKLGLSSYLMGNGMCFSSSVLAAHGWDAFTVGEDWEYYAKLVEAGETVAFANRARVFHQESRSLKQATSQRMRWSSGRFAVAGKYGFRLLGKGIVHRDLRTLDASLPLLFPNPSLAMNITIAGLLLSLAHAWVLAQKGFVIWFTALILLQTLCYLLGVLYTRNRMRNAFALFAAPLFLVWKVGIDLLSAAGLGRSRWVRTERKL